MRICSPRCVREAIRTHPQRSLTPLRCEHLAMETGRGLSPAVCHKHGTQLMLLAARHGVPLVLRKASVIASERRLILSAVTQFPQIDGQRGRPKVCAMNSAPTLDTAMMQRDTVSGVRALHRTVGTAMQRVVVIRSVVAEGGENDQQRWGAASPARMV